MLKWLSAIAILITGAAQAQNTKSFYTVQECGTPDVMFQVGVAYEEEILFFGTSMTFDTQGTPYVGSMMFAVNQDTGTWTMYTVYGDGTVCLTALGSNFEPE